MYLCTNVYVYSSLPTGRISLFLLTILFSTQLSLLTCPRAHSMYSTVPHVPISSLACYLI